MEFITDLVRLCVHLAQVKRQSSANDGWGQPAYSSAATISCFVAGANKRVVDAKGEDVRADFELIATATTSLAVNDVIETVKEPGGQTLLESGRIVSVKVVSHTTLGLIGTQAFIVRN